VKNSVSPSIIPKIILLLILSVGGGYFFFKWISKTDKNPILLEEKEDLLTKAFLSAIPDIKKRWFEGDFEGSYSTKKWQCQNLPNNIIVGDEYFKCNPDFLACWLRGEISNNEKLKKPIWEYRDIKIEPTELLPGKHFQLVMKSQSLNSQIPRSSVMISLIHQQSDTKMNLLLEDSCRVTYLPQRLYRYRLPGNDGESLLWDNFHRHFFIEKFFVSKRDIKDWIEETDYQVSFSYNDPSEWPQPSTDLTRSEQIKYCQWKGGKLLEAYLFDAATFLPLNISDPYGVGSSLSYLPWQMGKPISHEIEINEKECRKIYAEECEEKFKLIPFSKDSASWIGIFDVMSGIAENFHNSFHPDLNQKESSSLYKMSDPKQQLGLRVKGTKKGAFRCYYERL
jgi:hypothetical protein